MVPNSKAQVGLLRESLRSRHWSLFVLRFCAAVLVFCVVASVGIAATDDRPTTQSSVLAQRPSTGLPSGWEGLLAGLHAPLNPRDPALKLRAWSASQLLTAMRERARALELMIRRRRWGEAEGHVADLHRMALHLIDRLAAESPSDTARLWPALRVEVLLESLEESSRGDSPGRARIYARQVARVLEEMSAPPGTSPTPEKAASVPSASPEALRK